MNYMVLYQANRAWFIPIDFTQHQWDFYVKTPVSDLIQLPSVASDPAHYHFGDIDHGQIVDFNAVCARPHFDEDEAVFGWL
jgi:hypothetical protein